VAISISALEKRPAPFSLLYYLTSSLPLLYKRRGRKKEREKDSLG